MSLSRATFPRMLAQQPDAGARPILGAGDAAAAERRERERAWRGLGADCR